VSFFVMSSFSERVWEVIKRIPEGRVSTYKEVALALDCRAYRAVGGALNRNPFAPVVPCHRVVSSDGSLGGFASGCADKIRILKREGVLVKGNKVVDFDKKFFKLS